MPALAFTIQHNPVVIASPSKLLNDLFADYFRYYQPRAYEDGLTAAPLVIELETCTEAPPHEQLLAPHAELFAQTGVVKLWRDKATETRFYLHCGTAAFLIDSAQGQVHGYITAQALAQPHILANTYTLFALLLLLRARGSYHLHAAAVLAPNGELYLICGPQRAGKTTLTTALGLAGWRPLADDSLLVAAHAGTASCTPLKKYFHVADHLLTRWPALATIERRHHYLDRTCAAGLEFFETEELAGLSFAKIDRLILPQITNEARSCLEPIARSEALLKLAEQSMFFQLWREHTQKQWEALTRLTTHAACYRLLAGQDILADPQRAAVLLEQEV